MLDKIYLLRMNCEGTQVLVEEYELSDYPTLSNWFKEKEQKGLPVDPQKEAERVFEWKYELLH